MRAVLVLLWLAGLFTLHAVRPGSLSVIAHDADMGAQVRQALGTWDLPVHIEAFADRRSAVGQRVQAFLQPLDDLLDGLTVQYTAPDLHPDRARALSIGVRGEMVVTVGDAQLHLTELSLESLVNLLHRLRDRADRWLVFLEGFSAREVTSEADDGLFKLLQRLQKAGYPSARMTLNHSVQIPDNVGLLILPAPSETLPEAEIAWLQAAMARGVALWWLTEPELAGRQKTLELMFDAVPLEATDAADASAAVVSDFAAHPITEQFAASVYAPQSQAFLTSGQALWLDADGRALAAAEALGTHRQLLTGDADFIANRFLSMGGNQSMAMRMIDWLLGYDERVNIQEAVSPDQLLLSQQRLAAYSLVGLFVLPGLVALFGVWLGWRHRWRWRD